MTSSADILIAIPTYNERENVEKLCAEIVGLGLDVHILFVDDNSPDGTGDLLDVLAQKHPGLNVLHRPQKNGIGSAHLTAITWAYRQGYDTLVTMDADFTHLPSDVGVLLQHRDGYDVVVGTRFRDSASLDGWSAWRKLLTKLGHVLTRVLLNMDYDATGALRVYNLRTIPVEMFLRVKSMGYSFFFESLYLLHTNNFRIKEVPIRLPARTVGHSKMTLREIVHSVKQLFVMFGIRLRGNLDKTVPGAADVLRAHSSSDRD